MSVDVCKSCGANAAELFPISKKYLGINISQILCNLLQVNSEHTFAKSFICSSCITTLHLINDKIEKLRHAFAPPVKQMNSNFECSTPNTTNSANSKPIPEIQKARLCSVNVETPKKTDISNKNATPIISSKKTSNGKNSAETVQEIVVAKKTPLVIKPTTNSKVMINDESKEKEQDKIASSTGVESSLSYDVIDAEHSSTRLPDEPEKKEKKIPKRRNTIYHFDCDFCDFETGIVKAMQQHLIDVHEVKGPRIFECKPCSTKYTTKQGLDIHNKRHHPENGVDTSKNTTSQIVEMETENKTTKQLSPVKKIASTKSLTTPDVKPRPQKLKTPSDIKKGLNFTSSDDFGSPQKGSPVSQSVNRKLFKCDECPMVCDSAFNLDRHRSLHHCFIGNQTACESVQQSDSDVEYNDTTREITNGLNGSNVHEHEVPETDSETDNKTQVISSPKKSPKTSKSQTIGNGDVQEPEKSDIRFYLKVPGKSSVVPPKAKSNFNTKCDFCASIFDSPKNYANHLINLHGIEEPRVFKCTQCDKTYKTQSNQRRHIKQVHEKMNIDDVNTSDNEQDNNETKNDSDVEVSCFEGTQVHDDNASNSSMEYPFQIAKINALPVRISLDQNRADEPVRKTSGKEKITCSHCDQVMSNANELKRHLKVNHNISDEAVYVCDLCPSKYKHNKNLKKHKQNHHSFKANEDIAINTVNLIVGDEDNGSHPIKKQKKTNLAATPVKDNSLKSDDAETVAISPKKRKREDNKSEKVLTKSPKKRKHSVCFQEDQLDELDTNHSPQTNTCSECNKSFKSQEKLERHNKKRHTEKVLESFTCEVGTCHKQFMDKIYLDMHIKKKHPGVAV